MRRLLERSVVRYFFVGGAAAAFDFAFFTLFAYFLGLDYLAVGAVGGLLAIFVNYWLSVRFVFESGTRFSPRAELIAVYVVSGAGVLVHQMVLYLLVDGLLVHLLVSKILATGATFFWNYCLRRFYVFAPVRGCVEG